MRKTATSIIAFLGIFISSSFKWLGGLMDLLDLPDLEKKFDAISNKFGPGYYPILYMGFFIALLVVVNWPYISGIFKRNSEKKEDPKLSEIKPDINLSDAIDHVATFLYPNRNPSHTNFDGEHKEATEAVSAKLRSGELTAWGKRIEVVTEFHKPKYNTHTTDNDRLFKKEEWEYRKLMPLYASIASDYKPQTQSFGSGNDHVQLTDLRVDFNEVKKLWPLGNT